jgi:hypothetical protein
MTNCKGASCRTTIAPGFPILPIRNIEGIICSEAAAAGACFCSRIRCYGVGEASERRIVNSLNSGGLKFHLPYACACFKTAEVQLLKIHRQS